MKLILMMAMTADGKIAKNSGHLADWTSKEDKKFFIETTKNAGVIIMGRKTFDTFKKPLPNRLNVVFTTQKDCPEIEGVKWFSGEPEKLLAELEQMGYNTAILGGGTQLNNLFLEKKLIDEIMVTIEPKLFGSGLGLFSQECDIDLKLSEHQLINENSILLRYKVGV